eukprot:5591939-Pyramimonas_sp.AAC.1
MAAIPPIPVSLYHCADCAVLSSLYYCIAVLTALYHPHCTRYHCADCAVPSSPGQAGQAAGRLLPQEPLQDP